MTPPIPPSGARPKRVAEFPVGRDAVEGNFLMSSEFRAFVNIGGTVQPASEVRVPVLDHGFLYGDSVYETIRPYRGGPFLLDRHLDRLQRSIDRTFLALPVTRRGLEAEVLRTVDEVRRRLVAEAPGGGPGSEAPDVGIRVIVSRGVGPIGLDISKCPTPTCWILVYELSPHSVPPEAYPESSGGTVSVVISKIRRNSPRALDPAIKSGNFLNNILAFKDARDAGAIEAFLCNAEGYLAEGTTSNLFVAKNDLVWTPHAYGILDGITRGVLFEEAAAVGIRIGETNIPPEALFSADEVFFTGSIKGVVPVGRVNGRTIGSGRRGPITHRLQVLDAARMERECAGRERSRDADARDRLGGTASTPSVLGA